MRDVLLVGCGGFLGAVMRYGMSLMIAPVGAVRFPMATLVVNVTGSLVIGFVAGWGERTDLLSPAMRLLLMTGILGGYTTFSAFALESQTLLRNQAVAGAILNVMAHVVLGLLAVVAGHRLANLGA
ncbi:MAG: fluoride efflux transporter CrcB [Gemmatimonadaceae bacterium]|nr:fluoride efflux transporter CrcB [Gemmatimonadaceae bacterium]